MKLKGIYEARIIILLCILYNVYLSPPFPSQHHTPTIIRMYPPEKALSEAQKSLDEIRSEVLAWQAQYSDVRKELKEVKGTSDTLRVKINKHDLL